MTTWTIWPARVPSARALMWHLKGIWDWLSQNSHTAPCRRISETGTQQQVARTRCCCLHVPRSRFQDLTFKLWQSDCLSTWNAELITFCCVWPTDSRTEQCEIMTAYDRSVFNPLQAEPLWKFKYQVSPLLLVIKAWKPVGSRSNLDTSPGGARIQSYPETRHCIETREKNPTPPMRSRPKSIKVNSSSSGYHPQKPLRIKSGDNVVKMSTHKYHATSEQIYAWLWPQWEGCTKCGSHSELESG